jgi:DnaJ-class molecular chaperone
MDNHYKTLGIHKFSSAEQVKAAWMELAKQHHPDHHANDQVKAARMTEINVAYNTLKNSPQRRLYDKQLSLHGKTCPTCQGAAITKKQHGFLRKRTAPCPTCKGTGVL